MARWLVLFRGLLFGIRAGVNLLDGIGGAVSLVVYSMKHFGFMLELVFGTRII